MSGAGSNKFTLYTNPPKKQWEAIMARPAQHTEALESQVREIMNHVRQGGDAALLEYTKRYDGVELSSLVISKQDLEQVSSKVSVELKQAIQQSASNIESFHRSQKLMEQPVETMPGVCCFREERPIEKVGLYIPGGTAPLFSSVLMLAIPAKIAGCKEIVLVTPPGEGGTIHPAVAYSALISGVTKVIPVGGAQAIAALTYGTESVPKVYKILGPGNRYVTTAKLIATSEGTAIDMPAGPSEVMVVADSGADYRVITQDLLSQAEHGADSQSLLLTDSEEQGQRVFAYMNSLEFKERGDMIKSSLSHSSVVVFDLKQDMIDFMNQYAPEHLIISREDARDWIPLVQNAGSVFLGYYTPESVGDYASGTNHTLPTNGWARMYSGVNLSSYTKQLTFQELSLEGLGNIGDTVEIMAEAEGLNAHKQAVAVRRKIYGEES